MWGRIRKGVRNGVLYTITSCEDAVVKFEELPHSFTKNEIKEFPLGSGANLCELPGDRVSGGLHSPRAGPPPLHLEAPLCGDQQVSSS